MIIKIQVDKQKAKSLAEMSKITIDRLKETDILKFSTNTLTDYYDSIHKLMEAICFIEGVKIKGEGAHQELIDYICKKYNLGESIRIFLQEMRDFRNRVSYEGFIVNKNYIEQNKDKIENIIKNLDILVKTQG